MQLGEGISIVGVFNCFNHEASVEPSLFVFQPLKSHAPPQSWRLLTPLFLLFILHFHVNDGLFSTKLTRFLCRGAAAAATTIGAGGGISY